MSQAPPPPPLPGIPPPVPPPSGDPAPPGLDLPPILPPVVRVAPLPAAFIILILILACSLIANVVLAVRIGNETKQASDLRARVTQLEGDLKAIQEQSPGTRPAGVLSRIQRAVEQLRGLKFMKAVVPEVLTQDALRKRVSDSFKKDSPRAELEKTAGVLKVLGLLKPSDDLYTMLFEVQTEQVAGYYDSSTKKLVVTGNEVNPGPLDQILLSHELTHAVTDQHFGLSRLDQLQNKREDDAATAYVSLVEGDATTVMYEYSQKYLTSAQQLQAQNEAGSQSSSKLDAAPAVLRESLLFPYRAGVEFVRAVLAKGGTKLLDDAYKNPPVSTEQIMHPAKFFNHEKPQAVTLPNMAKAMGSGWSALDAGPAGELDIKILIDQFLSSDDAGNAAAGWAGGRYSAVKSTSGTLIVQEMAFDSQDEAREAAEIFGTWLRPRFGNAGNRFQPQGGGDGWQSPSGVGEVARAGTKVLLIIGPDAGSVDHARNAIPAFTNAA